MKILFIVLIFIAQFFNYSCQQKSNTATSPSDSDSTNSTNSTSTNSTLPAPNTFVVVAGLNSCTITWADVKDASSYKLFYSSSSGVSNASSSILNVTSPYTHSGLIAGTEYFYKIAAVNSSSVLGTLSEEVSAIPTMSSVAELIVIASANQTTISWGAVLGATSYDLYWGTSSAISTSSAKISNVTSPYTHSSLTPGNTYFYAMVAKNSSMTSEISSTSSGALVIPSTPTITVTPAAASNSISWSAISGATSYDLYWGTSTGITSASTKISNVTSPYTHSSLSPGTNYYYKLIAKAGSASSALSSEKNGIALAVPDTTAPTGSIQTSSGTNISSTKTFTINFDESMNSAVNPIFGGTLTTGKTVNFAWSQTTYVDDTLIVYVTGEWVTGNAKTLTVNGAKDLAGNYMNAINVNYNVFNTIYVSDANGNDSNSGLTYALPFKTLPQAFTLANSMGITNVKIAMGTYTSTSSFYIPAGAKVYGGYANADYPGDWLTARNTSQNSTVLNTTININGTDFSPSSTVVMGNGSRIDGLTINGPTSGNYTAGVYSYSNSDVVINNCYIAGGAGAFKSTGIISNSAFGGTISNNIITSGTSANTQYGIYDYGGSSGIVISGNTVTTSNAIDNYALYSSYSTAAISNNTFTGGSGTNSYGAYLNEFPGTFSGNTLNGGSGSITSTGVYATQNNYGNDTQNITGNIANGGSGATSIGIVVTGGGTKHPTVQKNKANGGSGSTKSIGLRHGICYGNIYNNYVYGGTGGNSIGVETFNSIYFSKFRNNTIDGGNASGTSYAIYDNTGYYDTAVTNSNKYDNNILMTSGGVTKICYAFRFAPYGSFKNNAFKGCTNLGKELFSSTNYTTVAALEALQPTVTQNNVSNSDYAFSLVNEAAPNTSWSNNDYSLDSSSHANIKGGGINGATNSFGFTDDISGGTRTVNWSIGAFEQDF